MILNEKRLVINNANGKISLAKSAMSCPKCREYATENMVLRQQIFHLNGLLTQERMKNKEMDALCEEIAKTKQKLYRKLLSRQQDLNAAIFVQQSHRRRTSTLRMAPNRMATLPYNYATSFFANQNNRIDSLKKYKELSTDRTFNQVTEQ